MVTVMVIEWGDSFSCKQFLFNVISSNDPDIRFYIDNEKYQVVLRSVTPNFIHIADRHQDFQAFLRREDWLRLRLWTFQRRVFVQCHDQVFAYLLGILEEPDVARVDDVECAGGKTYFIHIPNASAPR